MRTFRAASTIAAALLLSLVQRVDAQIVELPPIVAPNSAFLEVGGPGGFYSTNYEHLLNDVVSLRVGATSWNITSFDKQGEKMAAAIMGAAARVDISRYLGKEEGRYIELGATITIGNYSRSSYDTIEADGGFTTLVPMLGIRYQPPRGGFMYRATATPYVPLSGGTAQYPHEGVQPGASLSVGYAF